MRYFAQSLQTSFPVQGHQYEGTGWAARVQSITTRAGCGWSNPTKGACTKQISVLRCVLRELQPHGSNCTLSLPAQPGVVFPLIINKQRVLGSQLLQQTNTEDKIALTLQYLFPKPRKAAISYNYLPAHSVVQLPRAPANAARCWERHIKSWSWVSPTHLSHLTLAAEHHHVHVCKATYSSMQRIHGGLGLASAFHNGYFQPSGFYDTETHRQSSNDLRR